MEGASWSDAFHRRRCPQCSTTSRCLLLQCFQFRSQIKFYAVTNKAIDCIETVVVRELNSLRSRVRCRNLVGTHDEERQVTPIASFTCSNPDALSLRAVGQLPSMTLLSRDKSPPEHGNTSPQYAVLWHSQASPSLKSRPSSWKQISLQDIRTHGQKGRYTVLDTRSPEHTRCHAASKGENS